MFEKIIPLLNDDNVITVNNISIKAVDVLRQYDRTSSIYHTAHYIKFKTKCDDETATRIVQDAIETYSIDEDDNESDAVYNRPYQRGAFTSGFEKQPQEDPSTITCPYCHSTNVEKITLGKKAVKGWFWGIAAASTLTKEWHCKNCKSNF